MSEFGFLLVLADQFINRPNFNHKGIEPPMLVIKPNLLVQKVADHNQIE